MKKGLMEKSWLKGPALGVLFALGGVFLQVQGAEAITYYMKASNGVSVGADGNTNLPAGAPSATTTYPCRTLINTTEDGTGSRYYPAGFATSGTTYLIERLYSPVYSANGVDISAISASMGIRPAAANEAIRIELYDYDPAGAAGNKTLVATSTTKTLGAAGATAQTTWAAADFTISGTGRVLRDHRLLVEIYYTYRGTAGVRFYFGIAGTTTSTNFTMTETAVPNCTATTPSDLSAPTVAYNQVGLSWTGANCATNPTYNVYRNGTLLAAGTGLTCSAGTMTFTDSTVAANTTYNTPGYTVRGYTGTCESGDSNTVPVTTPTYTIGTTAGGFTFSNIGMASMDVAVAYAGDDDTNNSMTLAYGTAGAAGPWPNPVTVTRSGKSWVGTASGLTDSTTYYFRATFTDAGGVTGSPTDGSQKTSSNGLIHKGGVTGPKYSSGTWGANHTCATCHVENAPNIKRIRGTVNATVAETYNGRTMSNTGKAGTSTAGWATTTATNAVCDVCHTSTSVFKNAAADTVSGVVLSNGTPPHPNDLDCIKCHKHRQGFKVNAGCVSCHALAGTYQVGTAAFVIVDKSGAALRGEAYGGHLKALKTDSLVGLTDAQWDAQCLKCHDGHVKSPDSGVHIPNNTGVGINYTRGYIALGGTATSGSTEAEICWNCHDDAANGVSEWGVNTDTNGTGNNYNFGTVYTDANKTTQTSKWIGSYWTSANFSYKEGWLNNKPNTTNSVTGTANGGSTHAAAAGTQGVDAVSAIRCSYCHDVHNTAALTTGFLGAANDPNGKPYLRGRWVGSPYKEDGAPRQGQAGTYPAAANTTNPWGAVPRGSATVGTVMGGYQIDQNNGNPIAATYTATQFGGLCDLCHGTTKNGTLLAAEIDALNVYGTAGTGWVSALNGHSNAVDEGTDSTVAARNIFAGRGGANTQATLNTADHPYMGFQGTSLPGDASGGFRGTRSQWAYTPAMVTDPMDGGGWANTGWNNITGRALDWTGTTVDAGFHSFSCSKCHTPHASRLPALMISNCLDTKNNTWDNAFQVHATTDTVNAGRSISNWSSAQNCHRLGGNDPSDTRDTAANTATAGNKGWNTVTPW